MKKILVLFTLLISFSFANEYSCREALNLSKEFTKNDYYNTEVFILVDESTYFDENSKEGIFKKISPFIKENVRINIDSFTEYSKTRKNKDLGSYFIYSNLTKEEEDEISRSKVRDLKECLENAKIFAYNGIKKNLEKAYRKKEDHLKKSEILRNLKIYSKNNIRYSDAKRKVVIILSDMLENSEYLSFYKNGKVKEIDIEKEMEIVKKNRLLGKFNNAEIYVYGLGLVEVNSVKEDSRNSKILDNLIDFWDEYFTQSGGKPIGLDSSNMNFDIKY
ncbi:hypothetical protein OZZ08_07055 [Malaciobacter mytili]|uniref:hypothetical protein n=1 Tax=Malaciobacter mytili TaxID=603050 RepID=UPI003BB2070E